MQLGASQSSTIPHLSEEVLQVDEGVGGGGPLRRRLAPHGEGGDQVDGTVLGLPPPGCGLRRLCQHGAHVAGEQLGHLEAAQGEQGVNRSGGGGGYYSASGQQGQRRGGGGAGRLRARPTSVGKRSVSALTSSEAARRRVSESEPSVSRRTYSTQFISNISLSSGRMRRLGMTMLSHTCRSVAGSLKSAKCTLRATVVRKLIAFSASRSCAQRRRRIGLVRSSGMASLLPPGPPIHGTPRPRPALPLHPSPAPCPA